MAAMVDVITHLAPLSLSACLILGKPYCGNIFMALVLAKPTKECYRNLQNVIQKSKQDWLNFGRFYMDEFYTIAKFRNQTPSQNISTVCTLMHASSSRKTPNWTAFLLQHLVHLPILQSNLSEQNSVLTTRRTSTQCLVIAKQTMHLWTKRSQVTPGQERVLKWVNKTNGIIVHLWVLV